MAEQSLKNAASLVPVGAFAGKPAMPLTRAVTVIGSGKHSRILLKSDTVSTTHTLLVHTASGWYVRDLASRTHTILNGKPTREAPLKNGDTLTIGAFVFQFVTVAAATPPRPVVPAAFEITGAEIPVPIDTRTMVIGRRPGCEVRLVEESVSLIQAVVFEADGQHYVRDLYSRNGTFLNDRKTHQGPLSFGDVIRVGDTLMKYVADELPLSTDAFEATPIAAPTVVMSDPLAMAGAGIAQAIAKVATPATSDEPITLADEDNGRVVPIGRQHRPAAPTVSPVAPPPAAPVIPATPAIANRPINLPDGRPIDRPIDRLISPEPLVASEAGDPETDVLGLTPPLSTTYSDLVDVAPVPTINSPTTSRALDVVSEDVSAPAVPEVAAESVVTAAEIDVVRTDAEDEAGIAEPVAESQGSDERPALASFDVVEAALNGSTVPADTSDREAVAAQADDAAAPDIDGVEVDHEPAATDAADVEADILGLAPDAAANVAANAEEAIESTPVQVESEASVGAVEASPELGSASVDAVELEALADVRVESESADAEDTEKSAITEPVGSVEPVATDVADEHVAPPTFRGVATFGDSHDDHHDEHHESELPLASIHADDLMPASPEAAELAELQAQIRAALADPSTLVDRPLLSPDKPLVAADDPLLSKAARRARMIAEMLESNEEIEEEAEREAQSIEFATVPASATPTPPPILEPEPQAIVVDDVAAEDVAEDVAEDFVEATPAAAVSAPAVAEADPIVVVPIEDEAFVEASADQSVTAEPVAASSTVAQIPSSAIAVTQDFDALAATIDADRPEVPYEPASAEVEVAAPAVVDVATRDAFKPTDFISESTAFAPGLAEAGKADVDDAAAAAFARDHVVRVEVGPRTESIAGPVASSSEVVADHAAIPEAEVGDAEAADANANQSTDAVVEHHTPFSHAVAPIDDEIAADEIDAAAAHLVEADQEDIADEVLFAGHAATTPAQVSDTEEARAQDTSGRVDDDDAVEAASVDQAEVKRADSINLLVNDDAALDARLNAVLDRLLDGMPDVEPTLSARDELVDSDEDAAEAPHAASHSPFASGSSTGATESAEATADVTIEEAFADAEVDSEFETASTVEAGTDSPQVVVHMIEPAEAAESFNDALAQDDRVASLDAIAAAEPADALPIEAVPGVAALSDEHTESQIAVEEERAPIEVDQLNAGEVILTTPQETAAANAAADAWAEVAAVETGHSSHAVDAAVRLEDGSPLDTSEIDRPGNVGSEINTASEAAVEASSPVADASISAPTAAEDAASDAVVVDEAQASPRKPGRRGPNAAGDDASTPTAEVEPTAGRRKRGRPTKSAPVDVEPTDDSSSEAAKPTKPGRKPRRMAPAERAAQAAAAALAAAEAARVAAAVEATNVTFDADTMAAADVVARSVDPTLEPLVADRSGAESSSEDGVSIEATQDEAAAIEAEFAAGDTVALGTAEAAADDVSEASGTTALADSGFLDAGGVAEIVDVDPLDAAVAAVSTGDLGGLSVTAIDEVASELLAEQSGQPSLLDSAALTDQTSFDGVTDAEDLQIAALSDVQPVTVDGGAAEHIDQSGSLVPTAEVEAYAEPLATTVDAAELVASSTEPTDAAAPFATSIEVDAVAPTIGDFESSLSDGEGIALSAIADDVDSVSGADLSAADLSGADLSGAGVLAIETSAIEGASVTADGLAPLAEDESESVRISTGETRSVGHEAALITFDVQLDQDRAEASPPLIAEPSTLSGATMASAAFALSAQSIEDALDADDETEHVDVHVHAELDVEAIDEAIEETPPSIVDWQLPDELTPTNEAAAGDLADISEDASADELTPVVGDAVLPPMSIPAAELTQVTDADWADATPATAGRDVNFQLPPDAPQPAKNVSSTGTGRPPTSVVNVNVPSLEDLEATFNDAFAEALAMADGASFAKPPAALPAQPVKPAADRPEWKLDESLLDAAIEQERNARAGIHPIAPQPAPSATQTSAQPSAPKWELDESLLDALNAPKQTTQPISPTVPPATGPTSATAGKWELDESLLNAAIEQDRAARNRPQASPPSNPTPSNPRPAAPKWELDESLLDQVADADPLRGAMAPRPPIAPQFGGAAAGMMSLGGVGWTGDPTDGDFDPYPEALQPIRPGTGLQPLRGGPRRASRQRRPVPNETPIGEVPSLDETPDAASASTSAAAEAVAEVAPELSPIAKSAAAAEQAFVTQMPGPSATEAGWDAIAEGADASPPSSVPEDLGVPLARESFSMTGTLGSGDVFQEDEGATADHAPIDELPPSVVPAKPAAPTLPPRPSRKPRQPRQPRGEATVDQSFDADVNAAASPFAAQALPLVDAFSQAPTGDELDEVLARLDRDNKHGAGGQVDDHPPITQDRPIPNYREAAELDDVLGNQPIPAPFASHVPIEVTTARPNGRAPGVRRTRQQVNKLPIVLGLMLFVWLTVLMAAVYWPAPALVRGEVAFDNLNRVNKTDREAIQKSIRSKLVDNSGIGIAARRAMGDQYGNGFLDRSDLFKTVAESSRFEDAGDEMKFVVERRSTRAEGRTGHEADGRTVEAVRRRQQRPDRYAEQGCPGNPALGGNQGG